MARKPKGDAAPHMTPIDEPSLEAAEPDWMEPKAKGKTPAAQRQPTGEPDWHDNQDDPELAAAIKAWDRTGIVQALVEHGVARGRAVQFLDLFEEYREATINIRKYGVVATHPRDRNPIENPYLNRRDKARQALERFRDIEAPQIWKELA